MPCSTIARRIGKESSAAFIVRNGTSIACFVAFSIVVAFSIFVQGLTMPWLVRKLDVTAPPDEKAAA